VLKLQLFYDDQENKRFVSYGYPAWFDSSVWEARASYAFKRDVGAVSTETIVGASYREFDGRRRESFNSGMIAIDRRDISVGAQPNDIIDSPFSLEPAGVQGWNGRTTTGETGKRRACSSPAT
jgi:iron complex outermembrane receptor protein